MKKTGKKILTIFTCLVLTAATVALCSIAYFKESTQPESGTFTFANVTVSQDTKFQSRAPANTSITYDKNGYYISLSQSNINTKIAYSPKVTNTGDREIAAYLIVTYPQYIVNTNNREYKDVFTMPQLGLGSKWIKVKQQTLTSVKGRHTAIVYGYSKLIQPGESTEPLCTYITANAWQTNYNNKYNPVTDGYTKFSVQTSAIGIQNPIDTLESISSESGVYNWNSASEKYGPTAIIKQTWNYMMEQEQYWYVLTNIKNINDNISDDSKKAEG